MIEEFYFSLTLDRISQADAQKIIDFVIELKGTRTGMSTFYDEAI